MKINLGSDPAPHVILQSSYIDTQKVVVNALCLCNDIPIKCIEGGICHEDFAFVSVLGFCCI